jgi:hypothetical protein
LIGVECDGQEAVERLLTLRLPTTVTVQSSAPSRLHFWFRPWNGKTPQFVSFRFEKAGVTADEARCFLVPPAVHPGKPELGIPPGRIYQFLASPEDTEIAVMPEAKYDELVRLAKGDDDKLRQTLSSDPDAKIPEGRRRETIFKTACSDVRFGVPREAILEKARALNAAKCSPPLTDEQVVAQVDGAVFRYRPHPGLTRASESVESVGDSQGETEDDGLTDSALKESVGPESVPPNGTGGVLGVTQVPSQSESVPPGRPFALPISEFISLERPKAEPLLADADGRAVVAPKSLVLLGALGGHGKTTFSIDLFLHLAAGVDYPPFTVPHPVSILMIENEGPEELFARSSRRDSRPSRTS